MTPTVFRDSGFRFYFFSREEARIHIHVHHASGEAKFWLEPDVALAENFGLSASRISRASQLIREHENEIRVAWKAHFKLRGRGQ